MIAMALRLFDMAPFNGRSIVLLTRSEQRQSNHNKGQRADTTAK
jgi:hypothetical protein